MGRSRFASRLLKKTHMLRCAKSPRSNVLLKYAYARRFFARLASEIFLNNLQSKVKKTISKEGEQDEQQSCTFDRHFGAGGCCDTGCNWMNSQNSMPSHSMHESKMMSSKESATSAADLRISLNALLGEHVLIAAVATSHALGGRERPLRAQSVA